MIYLVSLITLKIIQIPIISHFGDLRVSSHFWSICPVGYPFVKLSVKSGRMNNSALTTIKQSDFLLYHVPRISNILC